MIPKPLPPFVRMPPRWVDDGGLRQFTWAKGEGANNLAALMVFTALLHRMEPHDGSVHRTYDQLEDATGLARALVARGLDVAIERQLVARGGGRSLYQVQDYDLEKPFAMFPAKSMYGGQHITAFRDFNLRRPAELDTLKFLFLCAVRRDRRSNSANITYDQIQNLAGIPEKNVPRTTFGAAALNLVFREQVQRSDGKPGVYHGYRIAGISSKKPTYPSSGSEGAGGFTPIDLD